MTHEDKILHLLLDRYERSGHCLPGKASNRRVGLSMTRGEYPGYRENDPDAEEVNQAVAVLASKGLVTPYWRYEGWLLDRVCLNLDALDRAYAVIGRVSLAKTAETLLSLIGKAETLIQTPWKLRFLEEEMERLQSNLHPSRLLPEDTAQTEAILKVLQYTENGPELMRVISTGCFHDSKYLERYLLPSLVSITKAYEPEMITYRALGDEDLPRNVVLEQLGILVYPEIFEFCGDIRLIFPESAFSTGAFQNGFCLHSENLRTLIKAELAGIHTLFFVENRTNYRYLVLRGVPEKTLLIYHGGFYSPAKRRLFTMLYNSAPSAKALFWGDIDLGGFLMFTRLKKNIFHSLIPWKMLLEDFEPYKEYGVERSQTYLDTLRAKLEEEQIDPIFSLTARAIIKERVTVEQEIMLWNYSD